MKHDITIKKLYKRFPEFTLDIDFTIHPREIVTLVGPSGCGKSTTLSLINGLLTPDSGSIWIGDKDVTQTPVWEREIGFVFQDYALFPHMDVKQNIGYGLKIRRTPAHSISKRVKELLKVIQLETYENRTIDSLSGGEKQRIALARAVAPRPKLLLLDEPLSALDAKLRIQLRKEIQRIHHDLHLTTLYVTHDQEEALAISDRIVVMNSGHIEQIGTPEEIYQNPASLFVAQFIGISNLIPISSDAHRDSDRHIVSIHGKDVLRVPISAEYRTGGTEPCYIYFRPESVSVLTSADTIPENRNVLRSARLEFQEYAGQYYICTFQYHGQQIQAYTRRKLVLNQEYILSFEVDSTKTLM